MWEPGRSSFGELGMGVWRLYEGWFFEYRAGELAGS